MKNRRTLKAVLTALYVTAVMFLTQTALFAAETTPTLPDAGGRGRIIIYTAGSILVFAAFVGFLWIIWKYKNDKNDKD